MGMCAHIHLTSPDAYLSALRGDLEGLSAGWKGLVADLDKTWHAIHYLVTGDCELRFLIGGVQIEGVSDPFEAHSPEYTTALHQELSSTSVLAIMANYDPEVLNLKNIYIRPWDDWGYKYVRHHLEIFISAIRQAAEQGRGIAVFFG